jgi:hypothetical protein
MDINSVGILSVATNRYVNYWKDLAISINDVVNKDEMEFTLHVFTDQPDAVRKIADELTKLTVKTYKIPSYGWPEATLYRYRIFREHQSSLTESLLIHLDADMRVFTDFTKKLPSELVNGIGLVLHPGYFRPSGLDLIKYYFSQQKRLIIDFRMKTRFGGIGSWERDAKYLAFVPRSKRNHYVCGGTWLGSRENFLTMVDELADMEMRDSAKGLIPTWHDESILNKWSSQNKTTLLSPSFCYEPTYPQLISLPEYIRAVDKGES